MTVLVLASQSARERNIKISLRLHTSFVSEAAQPPVRNITTLDFFLESTKYKAKVVLVSAKRTQTFTRLGSTNNECVQLMPDREFLWTKEARKICRVLCESELKFLSSFVEN